MHSSKNTATAQGLAIATFRSDLLDRLAGESGLTAHDLAVLCDVPNDEARRWLQEAKAPAFGPAVALAALFGRDVTDFLRANGPTVQRRRFRAWRLRSGMTHQDVERIAQVEHGTCDRWEAGREEIGVSAAIRLAQQAGQSLETFLSSFTSRTPTICDRMFILAGEAAQIRRTESPQRAEELIGSPGAAFASLQVQA